MNYLDIAFCIPLLWGLYKGFTKGFIIEVAQLIALGLAAWGAIKFHNFFSKCLVEAFGWTSSYIPIVSFCLLFIGILLLVFGTAKLIERLVKAVALGIFNKLAGAIFGMLKFGIILSLLIFLLNKIEKNIEVIPVAVKESSLLYTPIGKIAPMIIPGLKTVSLAIEK